MAVGDELRLVVKSAQHSTAFYAHLTKTYNVCHYYVGIDLKSKTTLQTAATIIGPLWVEKNTDWQAEFIPRWPRNMQAGFDSNGELRRIKWNEEQRKWERELLSIEQNGAKWTPAGFISPIPGPTNIFAHNLRSGSGNWQIYINTNRAPELYETATGQSTKDPWLEDVVSKLYQVRSIGVEGRIEDVKLTDDLKYVVYWPYTSFGWNGQTYPLVEKLYHQWIKKTQEHAVIFERPSPEGVVVRKGDWADGWSGGPLGFFSIRGELLLLKHSTNYFALVDRQGAARFCVTVPDLKPHYRTTQQDSRGKRLVFFDNLVIPKPLEVRIWDYQSGDCSIFKFNLFSLFDTSFSGALHPRKMIRVQSEKSAKQ